MNFAGPSDTPMRTLEDLNEDVFHHILMEIKSITEGGKWLKMLSLTCSRMHDSCIPLLYQRCYGRTFSHGEVPPETIRPHVRHITFAGEFASRADLYALGYMPFFGYLAGTEPPAFVTAGAIRSDVRPFGAELSYFPAARSVTFCSLGGVPWYALQRCLEHVDTISIADSPWTCVLPPPTSAHIPSGVRLVNFVYTVSLWRGVEGQLYSRDMQAAYELESTYLQLIVSSMADHAQKLVLPIETAPLERMAALRWPHLRTLSLYSTQLQPSLYDTLPDVLVQMPELRSLSLLLSSPNRPPRIRLLKDASKGQWCRNLRSLTVSYPNPTDAMFASLTHRLTHLSLRDTPRYYLYDRYGDFFSHAEQPLLTSSACLEILRSTTLAQVTTLEVVYLADDAEDDMLSHIVSACPLLEVIELHRYRELEDDNVPYLHIARILQSAKLLRAVYLNFDFHDIRHSAWDDPDVVRGYFGEIERRAQDLLPVLQECRQIEFFAFLINTDDEGRWMKFRLAGPDARRFPKWNTCSLYVLLYLLRFCGLTDPVEMPRLLLFLFLDSSYGREMSSASQVNTQIRLDPCLLIVPDSHNSHHRILHLHPALPSRYRSQSRCFPETDVHDQ
ncbi:hypothetical protein NUW54_g2641 [Trametes sanguinea]|uniref:Uncharacterized protein n=1 Tax=Trametes sanguinea TaxID=158606 RepID=A0ACC1Q4N9_9APHY|nr:hypothetical protein NUW54_g2641 [Trametes sanguinea]